MLLVAAAAAAGHLGRGVHHRRGRAGCASGYAGYAGCAGCEGVRERSVSRDSCGWIARPRRLETRGVARTSRHGVRSANPPEAGFRRDRGCVLDGTRKSTGGRLPRTGNDPGADREARVRARARSECGGARDGRALRVAERRCFDIEAWPIPVTSAMSRARATTPQATTFELRAVEIWLATVRCARPPPHGSRRRSRPLKETRAFRTRWRRTRDRATRRRASGTRGMRAVRSPRLPATRAGWVPVPPALRPSGSRRLDSGLSRRRACAPSAPPRRATGRPVCSCTSSPSWTAAAWRLPRWAISRALSSPTRTASSTRGRTRTASCGAPRCTSTLA